MKHIRIFLLCICVFCLLSCYSGQFVDDIIAVKYIPSCYYDNNISVVYINRIPYYQYWDAYNKCWYRRQVPVHRHKHIVYRHNTYHKHHTVQKPHNHHIDRHHNRHFDRPHNKTNHRNSTHNRNVGRNNRNK